MVPRASLGCAVLALLLFAVAPLLAAEPTAQLGTVTGTVAVTFGNGSALQPAGAGTSLGAGDRISTVGKGSATVELPGLGQIELGADTTVVIQELRTDSGTTMLSLLIVRGALVNRLAPAPDTRLEYRVFDPSGAATVRAVGTAIFGVGRDDNGNVTVVCVRCTPGVLRFPTDQFGLSTGQARTVTARGDVLDRGISGSVYDALAEGASAEENGGNTPSGNRLPPGQRTGSHDDRHTDQEDDDPGQNSASSPAGLTATPTPTATVTVTPTASPTPTATATPTRVPTIAEATIANFVYLPDPAQIHVGDSIRWTNLDDVQSGHTVTDVNHTFTSPVLNLGDTYVHTFTQPGTFEYFCEPHPFMTAFIEVSP